MKTFLKKYNPATDEYDKIEFAKIKHMLKYIIKYAQYITLYDGKDRKEFYRNYIELPDTGDCKREDALSSYTYSLILDTKKAVNNTDGLTIKYSIDDKTYNLKEIIREVQHHVEFMKQNPARYSIIID